VTGASKDRIRHAKGCPEPFKRVFRDVRGFEKRSNDRFFCLFRAKESVYVLQGIGIRPVRLARDGKVIHTSFWMSFARQSLVGILVSSRLNLGDLRSEVS